MIAAQQIFLGRGGAKVPTAADYVQDGLVAMWDGIENAGWGTHGSNLPVDLIGGIGNFSLSRASAAVDENSVVFSSFGRIITPFYRIGNQVLTMQIRALRSGGSSLGELGVLWENPWFGINLRPQGPCVRFTCGQDIDFLTDITKAETYTLVRGATKCTFYKGVTLLGQQNISITSIATRQLAAGNWQSANYGDVVNGNLFAVRLYSRALTADEIAANYAIDKERFNLP